MHRALVASAVFCLVAGEAVGQAPIAPPTSPAESAYHGGREAPTKQSELVGSWIADASGENIRFDEAGAFDGSTLGAGRYELGQGRLVLLRHGQVVCAYRASSVTLPDYEMLRLQPERASGARCPSGTFTSEYRPRSARADTGEPVPPSAAPASSARPPPLGLGRADLVVTHVTARPKAGRLIGNVAFSVMSSAGRIRIEVPFAGARSRDAAIVETRKSLEAALGIGPGE